MNLLHLKYAVEVAKTSSITKAAENLYMGQPNLSRGIKELEESLGVVLFKRTPKGMIPTSEGEEFLFYAKKILSQLDTVENMFREDALQCSRFSISVPRADYISCAFARFAKNLDRSHGTEIFYKETNALRTVKNVLGSEYNMGILRYQLSYDKYYKSMLSEKGLHGELVCEFEPMVIMSESNPLSQKETLGQSDLSGLTEIVHADPYVPSLPMSEVRREEIDANADKHIFVFERSSQMELLSEMDNAFMRVSPVPQKLLERFSLIQRPMPSENKRYKDVLIYKEEYRLSELDKRFIDELMNVKRELAAGDYPVF